MQDPIPLLESLVAIPSVNPMGGSGEGAIYYETAIAAFIESWLEDRGIAVERMPVAAGRDNLIARVGADPRRPTILFDAHMDTVPVAGMTIPPFEPTISAGRLFGRGSCDIKSGLAAMLAAFSAIHAEQPQAAANLILACTVDEEFTHLGSSRLAEAIGRIDLAIIAEPTGLDIVTCHKGAVRWKLNAQGKACHSSTPKLGDNALYRMAKALIALETYADTLASKHVDSMLGPATLSVGKISGGLSVNVVPDHCEIEIDRRLLPGETGAAAMADALDALRRSLREDDFAKIAFSEPWLTLPALSPGPAEPWLGPLGRAVQAAVGAAPRVIGVPYGTDAGPLAEAGAPCVVFGGGDIAQAHTKDEWIAIDQVRRAAEVYYRFALIEPPEGVARLR